MVFSLPRIIDCPSFDATLAQLEPELVRGLKELRSEKLQRIAAIPGGNAPVFFHTLGFASSGKSTLLKYCREEEKIFPEHAFHLGFDAIMEGFDAYQNDFAALGPQLAFDIWELPARALGYELLDAALQQKLPVIFEHSGSRADHVTMLEQAKNVLDYRIVILELECDPEIALQRAAKRPRYLPAHYVYARRKIIKDLYPAYHRIADEWRIYDTTHFPPRQMMQDAA